MWDMIHSYVWHDPCICVTWLIHRCDMTHSCAWHDSFICAAWHYFCVRRYSCVGVSPWLVSMTWLVYTCICVGWLSSCLRHETFTRVWHDSFICGTWLIHMWDMTLIYMCSVTLYLCGTRMISVLCDMTHSNVGHDSFICVTWRTRMWDMTHLYM